MSDMTEGASIAVNGVCLTAVDPRPDSFSADLAPETLRRSNLGDSARRVARESGAAPVAHRAAERPHRAGPRGWHRRVPVARIDLGDENWWLRIRVPAELDPFLVYKGSIAIDGISLTIAALESGRALRDHHPAHLPQHHARRLPPRRRVNLECDILAKHVEKLLRKLDLKGGLTVEKLRDQGY